MNTPKIQHVVYMNDYKSCFDGQSTCYRTIDTVDGSEHYYYMVYPDRTCDQMCVIESQKEFICCSDNSIFVY